jgi:hypothetical protein
VAAERERQRTVAATVGPARSVPQQNSPPTSSGANPAIPIDSDSLAVDIRWPVVPLVRAQPPTPSFGKVMPVMCIRRAHAVTCNIVLCHLPGTAFDDTAHGYGNEACGQSRSGFPM